MEAAYKDPSNMNMKKTISLICLVFLSNCLKSKKSAFDISAGGFSFFAFYGFLLSEAFQIKTVTVPGTSSKASLIPDITILFSAEPDSSSVTESTVKVIDKDGKQISADLGISDKTLTVSVSSILSVSSDYQLKISSQVKDKSGRNLGSDYSTSFTTDSGTDHFLKDSSLNNDLISPLGYTVSTRLFSFSDRLYIAWTEKADANIGNNALVYVKSIDKNKSVSSVGTNLNYDSAKSSDSPSMASVGSTLYLAWKEGTEIRVKSYNGSAWTSSDGNATLTSTASPSASDRPILLSHSSRLYCIFGEEISVGVRTVRIKEFNGTSWSFIDGGFLNSKTPTSTDGPGYKPVLASFNGSLYAAWIEKNAGTSGLDVRVKKYSGSSSWTFVDGGGIQNNSGVSANADITPFQTALAVNKNKLYAFWMEDISGSNRRIRGKVFNGNDSSPSWTSVDGGVPLNYASPTYSAFGLTAEIHNNRIYLLWQEASANAIQLRLSAYKGNDSSPGWFFADSNPVTDRGLTLNTSKSPAPGTMASFNGNLYVGWSEQASGNEYNIYISRMAY